MHLRADDSSIDFAQQRMEVVNRLAAGVAHEFNNVLQIVRGYVAFARDTLPPGAEARDDLDKALLATDRAADLSRRLLQFARADDDSAGRADCADAIDALRLLLRPIIGENIEVVCDASPDLPPAVGGDATLRQALLNLCVNARDAMPHGGVLRLSADVVERPAPEGLVDGSLGERPCVRVKVSDTGTGIPPEALGHVFEPFFSTKPPGEGTGLGLPMVAAFARSSGGAVAVTSRMGGGTTFELYLPIAEGEDDRLHGAESAEPGLTSLLPTEAGVA